MAIKRHGTALLVFSLSAKKEASRKHVFGKRNSDANTVFFHKIIAQTRALVAQSDIDVIWVDEHKQRGHNFATRYANAFQDLFNAGYDQVLSIGNDCPGITVGILGHAKTLLETQKIVAGPAADGGVYVFGLHKSNFDQEAFKKLPWQKATLYKTIVQEAAAAQIELSQLDVLIDLDSDREVRTYAKQHRTTSLGILLLNILNTLKVSIAQRIERYVSLNSSLTLALRGPPIC